MLAIFKFIVAMFIVLALIIAYRFWHDRHRWISLGHVAVIIAMVSSVAQL